MFNTGIEQLRVINEPWKLGEGWQWKPLSYLAKDPERRNPNKEFPSNYFQYVNIASIDNRLGIITGPQRILGQQAPSRARKVIRSDDIIIATTRPYLKNIAIVTSEFNGAICSTGFCVLRVNQFFAFPKYIYYACRSDIVINQLIPKQRGANYPAVTDKDVFNVLVPVPYPDNKIYSLDIQRRIVARIEALLDEVRESRRLLDEMRRDTERLLAVSLNEVFTKLEPVIDTVPLSEVATAFNGRASGEGDSDVRVFKTKHVYPHYLRLNNPSYMKEEQVQKMRQDRYLRPGDVLMANIAEGTLGRVSYVKECEDSWTVDAQIMILRSKDEEELLGKWLYYYLWSEQGQREILSRRTGIAFADKRGQTHIYPKNLAEIPVPKPPIQQQRQAVAYLDTIQHEADAMLKLLEQDAESLDMLEQSILERAFRGEL